LFFVTANSEQERYKESFISLFPVFLIESLCGLEIADCRFELEDYEGKRLYAYSSIKKRCRQNDIG